MIGRRSPLPPVTSAPAFLPSIPNTYRPPFYLPIFLSSFLPVFLHSSLPPLYLPASFFLSSFLSTFYPSCLSSILPAYLPVYLRDPPNVSASLYVPCSLFIEKQSIIFTYKLCALYYVFHSSDHCYDGDGC